MLPSAITAARTFWRSCLALALLLSVCISVASADLTISGDVKVKPHRLVRLRLTGHDPKSAIRWRVSPRAGVDRADSPPGTFQFTAPPGTYVVEAESLKIGPDNSIVSEETQVTVTIEGAAPVVPEKPPAPKINPEGAIGSIQFGRSGCTATVIHPQRPDKRWDVLTARHCLAKVGQKGQMKLSGGKRFGITVTAIATEPDIAWCVTDEPHDDLPCAFLAKEIPPKGTRIWHKGYGVDKPGNKETGTVLGGPDSSGMMVLRISVSSGDSGSGMFREDNGEVISTLYGWRTDPTYGRVSIGGACTLAWKLRPSPTSAIPAEVEPTKPPCSNLCVCGCNEGKPCRCGNPPVN